MADQTVRTDNGSPQRVAFDLWHRLSPVYPEGTTHKDQVAQALELYRACLLVANGFKVDVSGLS